VAVLMGGPGVERAVSLSTGQECASALRQAGYSVVEIDAGPDVVRALILAKPDVVFNALHGRWGEDGCVQGLLEWMKLPYTHSGVLCSALAMDKEKTKDVFRSVGLPVMDSLLMARDNFVGTHPMALPYVVKPNNEGSSVGVYLVSLGAETPPQLSTDMPDMVMIEAFAPGRELTTTVVGDRALTVTDILTDSWYDYDAKYTEGGSKHVVPKPMRFWVVAASPAQTFVGMKRVALKGWFCWKLTHSRE
jgi:D-alanine-D-alanine ligase